MPDVKDEELGPIDYLVVEFPPGTDRFNGALAAEIASLVDAEIIRVLDLVVIQKAEDGSYDVTELEDMSDLGDLGVLEGQLAEILAADDVANIADVLAPGATAGVLVWENTWAAPFAVTARKMGARLVANDRIHTQELIASMQAAAETEGA